MTGYDIIPDIDRLVGTLDGLGYRRGDICSENTVSYEDHEP